MESSALQVSGAPPLTETDFRFPARRGARVLPQPSLSAQLKPDGRRCLPEGVELSVTPAAW